MTNLSLGKLKVLHKFTIYTGQTLPKPDTNCLENSKLHKEAECSHNSNAAPFEINVCGSINISQ